VGEVHTITYTIHFYPRDAS